MENNYSLDINLNSPTVKKLIGIILSSFLVTFVVARLFIYLVMNRLAPNFFLMIKGVHVHHFTYGFFILATMGLFLILKQPSPTSKLFRWIAWIYGVGLGLAMDEFGMWIRLEDDYWTRQSFDAVIIITLLLLNIAYFKQITSWIKEIFENKE